jgi:hypothetical protein
LFSTSRVQQSKGFFDFFTLEEGSDRGFPTTRSVITHTRYVTTQKSKDLEIISVYSGKRK